MQRNWIFTALAATSMTGLASAAAAYDGTSVDEVWSILSSDTYEKPHYQVTLGSMFNFGVSYIKMAADRTLSDQDDLLPRFTKLVHPNGVCLKGDWVMDGSSPYTGYFAAGSHGLVIARASTALSDTERSTYRAFGMSVKVYPTLSPSETVKTANFFAIDDLGGLKTEHFLDTTLTNEPAVSVRPSSVLVAPVGAAVAAAFAKADINPGIRQLYPVSELSLAPGAVARTPKWLKLSATPGQGRLDVADFRDEFDLGAVPGGQISFDVAVASERDSRGLKNWVTIGHVLFTDSVVSDSCDHRLHFHHPKFRNDLKY